MMPPSGKPLVGRRMPRRLAPLRTGSGTGGLASLRVRRHGVAKTMPTQLRCFGLRAGRSAPMADELIPWPDWAPAYLRHLKGLPLVLSRLVGPRYCATQPAGHRLDAVLVSRRPWTKAGDH